MASLGISSGFEKFTFSESIELKRPELEFLKSLWGLGTEEE
jgi:hypothetical protein